MFSSVVDRLNSWSRINITIDIFWLIFNFYHMTPHFLKLVIGFRRKFSSGDEDFTSCYSGCSYQDEDLYCKIKEEDNPIKSETTGKWPLFLFFNY